MVRNTLITHFGSVLGLWPRHGSTKGLNRVKRIKQFLLVSMVGLLGACASTASYEQSSDVCDVEARDEAGKIRDNNAIAIPYLVLMLPVMWAATPHFIGEMVNKADAVENKRQNCHQEAAQRQVANERNRRVAEQQRQIEERDSKLGFKQVSFQEFQLDARTMMGEKLSITGVFRRAGYVDVLYADMMGAYDRGNAVAIPLLTENAARDFRQRLLTCRSEYQNCQVTVLGRVTRCTMTTMLGVTREEYCIEAIDGR